MKIGLDIMGGDYAPQSTVEGALMSLNCLSPEDTLVLFGKKELIQEELLKRGNEFMHHLEIVDCSQLIEMGDKPMKVIQEKPDSSIAVGFQYLQENKIDSFASAGNSGAVLAGAMYSVKTVAGVLRPCTLTTLPQEDGRNAVLLDIGTMPDARPDVLKQFGLIGKIYSEKILKIDNPKVAFLNIGTEDGKGNMQAQAAFPLLKEHEEINFVGNLEPRDLFKSKADVFVCDGFVGNIVIKLIETFYRLYQKRNYQDDFLDRFNYELYGGSPILGMNAPIVLGHGISSSLAIKNMVMLSKTMYETKIVDQLRSDFA